MISFDFAPKAVELVSNSINQHSISKFKSISCFN
jgi:hypothetical protein